MRREGLATRQALRHALPSCAQTARCRTKLEGELVELTSRLEVGGVVPELWERSRISMTYLTHQAKGSRTTPSPASSKKSRTCYAGPECQKATISWR